MIKRVMLSLVILLASAINLAGGLSCDNGDSGQGTPDLPTGKGRISGVVTDAKEYLPQGTSPQTYEGAIIRISVAAEAGRYRLSEDAPWQIDYEAGGQLFEVKSRKDGYWQVDLSPGKYFIKALYGEGSYSEDILIEVEEGQEIKLDLGLIHGI
jgi:hypothetical protein